VKILKKGIEVKRELYEQEGQDKHCKTKGIFSDLCLKDFIC